MSVPRTDVLVIGGGVVGVAIADALARRGVACVLLERRHVATAASAGAAGLLAATHEAGEEGPFERLAFAGRAAFAEEARALVRDTGIDIGYRETGTLRVAEHEAEVPALLAAASGRSDEFRYLDRDDLLALEPGLSPRVVGALLSRDDHQVTSRLMARALASRAAASGATIVEGLAVQRLLMVGRRVVGARTARAEEIRARWVVLAAGPWSPELAPVPLPVRPVKGQLIHLRPPDAVLAHAVFANDAYLAPKPEGHVVVGATEEDVGFDVSVRPEVTRELAASAARLVPGLERAPVVEEWAGLRPGTPDRLPVIGTHRDVEGLIFATGHFRNGVLLSLVTARIVAAIVAGEEPGVDIAAFSPERFAVASR